MQATWSGMHPVKDKCVCMAQVSVDQMVAQLAAQVERKMGIRGRDPVACLKTATRRLPYAQRKALVTLLEAQPLAQNPKLARRLDMSKLQAAERTVSNYLQGYDMADRRVGAVLGVLGSLAFSLLAVAALVIVILVWRGLV